MGRTAGRGCRVEKSDWHLLESLHLSLLTSNHNDLQCIMAVASLHFPNLVQVFLLAQANSEPNRKEYSKL